MRKRWLIVALAAALCAAGLGAPVRPAQAALLGRHTILGQIFRLTPAGRVVATFEARRDAYREAQTWLEAQRSAAQQRDAQLRRALQNRQIDLHTYVHARAHNERRLAQYDEVKDRMTRIAADNFNRALGQQVLERLMPRLAQSAGFNQRVGEIKAALETTRQVLAGGALEIDRLASKAYPEFMREGRVKVQELLGRLERSGLGGGPVEDVRCALQGLERRLGALEREAPEMAKPDEVKRLQEEARQAAERLATAQSRLEQGVQRLRDRNTVYFAQRPARDAWVQARLKELGQDTSQVDRAIAESEARRAIGPRLEEALVRVGVERGDPLYAKIRQRALNLLDASKAEEISDGELDTLCATAREQIEREAAQTPLFGVATLDADAASLPQRPDWGRLGDIQWHWFQYDLPPSDLPHTIGCTSNYPAPPITELEMHLALNLDTGEMEGGWWGVASGGFLDGPGTALGSFSAEIIAGRVTPDADGKGFSFEGKAWVTLTVAGASDCGGNEKEGVKSSALEASVRGRWRAGEGELTVTGWDQETNLRHHLVSVNPPFVLP